MGSRRNGPRKGRDIRVDMTLAFEDAAFGTSKTIEFLRTEECDVCHGDGAEPGTGKHKCETCHGSGEVRYSQRSLFGESISVKQCPTCKGHGKIKKRYSKTIETPPGVYHGANMQIRNEG